MNTLVDLKQPPFFTALYLTAENGANEGLHSEAISVMLSLAMVLSGFLGFRDDKAAGDRRVRIVFWKNYKAMKAWEKTGRDLLPHYVQLEHCIASEGCLWRWLDDGSETSAAPMIKAA